MGFFQNIFKNTSGDLRQLIDQGAVIIDVRTPAEYNSGHIKTSKNFPLNELKQKVDELRSYQKPLIIVCQSGMRSGTAKSFLEGRGLQAINGGSWSALNNIV
ncbi:rhodanese-like domain-containing protein [Flavisolibacter nicotianae]|uniref:rhodanese-like domain-containing protein n=1 Tax=Flavisolibacter nicotianae TaxID=2364882 RepID=UPI000EB192A7|nr:rhodanese-like domain-containing protein [Flavisolibacter nicotianae]